jgi:hypothetical protein
MAACVEPWYEPWNATTVPRPVAFLHSLIAASTASAPVGPLKCIFMSSRRRAGNMPS